jgi:hypothetical protein
MGASASALSGVGDFFGNIAGSFSNIFKNMLGGASSLSSLFSSPIILIGGGCVVLYFVMSSKGSANK